MNIRIFYEDTDVGAIVYHANYIKFCERARSEACFAFAGDVFNQRRYFVVTGIECKFHAPARLGEVVAVRTRLAWQKAASVAFEQEIWRVGEAGCSLSELLKPAQSGSHLLFSGVFSEAFMSCAKPARLDETALNLLSHFKEWVE